MTKEPTFDELKRRVSDLLWDTLPPEASLGTARMMSERLTGDILKEWEIVAEGRRMEETPEPAFATAPRTVPGAPAPELDD